MIAPKFNIEVLHLAKQAENVGKMENCVQIYNAPPLWMFVMLHSLS